MTERLGGGPLTRPGELVTGTRESGAAFSGCGRFRYRLWRVWDNAAQAVLFVGLNPSTADATTDDPTIRRCIRFARDWGYGGLLMGNLYPDRSTNPDALLTRQRNPFHMFVNEADLAEMAESAGLIVAAWGAHKAVADRAPFILPMLACHGTVHVLGLTAAGHPRHPLYMRADTKPERWARPLQRGAA